MSEKKSSIAFVTVIGEWSGNECISPIGQKCTLFVGCAKKFNYCKAPIEMCVSNSHAIGFEFS